MTNHTPVTRNLQSKSVPSEPSFFGADECAETDARADDNQDRQPPVRDDAVMNLHQDPRRQRKGAADLGHESGQLRHHVSDEDCDQRRAGDCEKRRIDQRLLNAVAQILRLHQMFYEPVQNLRQRPACFARRNEIDKERRKNSWHLAQGLRKTSAINQRLMQCSRHFLHSRLFEPLL